MLHELKSQPQDVSPRRRTLEAWGVVAAFLVMVVSNVLSTSTGWFNNTNNADISDDNPTFISPDGATFSIWGFIYLFEATLTIYQALPSTRGNDAFAVSRVYIILAFALNAIWLPVFQFYRWWLSLAIIVLYLAALREAYLCLGVNYGSQRQSWVIKVLAHTGISLNFSWVLVATLLNVSIVCRQSAIMYTDVTDQVTNATAGYLPDMASPVARVGGNEDFAVLCMTLASAVALYRAVRMRDVPYCFVAAWAVGGIYRMQKFAPAAKFPTAAKSEDLRTWAAVMIVVVGLSGVFALCAAIYDVHFAQKQADGTGLRTSLSRQEGGPETRGSNV